MAKKKFLYCQNCSRWVWAKLEGVRWICLGCGQEITYSEKGDENVSPEPMKTGTLLGYFIGAVVVLLLKIGGKIDAMDKERNATNTRIRTPWRYCYCKILAQF